MGEHKLPYLLTYLLRIEPVMSQSKSHVSPFIVTQPDVALAGVAPVHGELVVQKATTAYSTFIFDYRSMYVTDRPS